MGVNANIGTGSGGPVVTSYTCEITPTYVAEDNLTRANKFEMTAVDCPEIPMNHTADFWNCTMCGNDDRYESPMLDTDEFYLQFKENTGQFGFYYAFLLDPDGNFVEMPMSTGVVIFGVNDGHNTYVNIKLTAASIPADCFYMKFIAFRGDLNVGDLDDCVALKMAGGMGIQEATHDCLLELYIDNEIRYTDQYRKTSDECEDTILIEGDYDSKYDCVGRYYGEYNGNRFILRVRVPGTIESTDLEFETTKVNDVVRTNKMLETYMFRTNKITPTAAGEVAIAFAGRHFYISDPYFFSSREFFDPSKVSKNNEEGRMWILNVTLHKDCEEVDFACEN